MFLRYCVEYLEMYTNNIICVDFFLNNQPDALIIPNLFCYKTLHVSGIFFAHHQEFSTVHSALVSFIEVLMTASKQFHRDSAWIRSSKPA